MDIPADVLFIFSMLLGSCVCPTSYQIARIATTSATWEQASDGSIIDSSLAVPGATDPIDGEKQYICRAGNGDAMVPGKLVPMHGKCYIARGGQEHGSTSYEVLLNRDGFDLEWVNDSNGNFPSGSVIGGVASGWTMFICRAWIKGREDRWRWVSGKLDPEPGFECCYIPYAGRERCEKSYQVLRNKL